MIDAQESITAAYRSIVAIPASCLYNPAYMKAIKSHNHSYTVLYVDP